MRNLVLMVVFLALVAGAIYQQVHHLDTILTGFGAIVVFIVLITPDALLNAVIDKIKREHLWGGERASVQEAPPTNPTPAHSKALR